MEANIVYEVQGKYWDTDLAEWVAEPDASKEVVVLRSNGQPAGEDVLVRTLKLYKFSLGELEDSTETIDEEGVLRDRIAKLEESLAMLRTQVEAFQASAEESSAEEASKDSEEPNDGV